MNIVQAYTKFNNQNIILISGFSGSHKTKIAKFVSDIFGFQIISLTKFFKSDKEYDIDENYVTLKDGTKILNWDDIHKSIDWTKFNEFVNSNKKQGIVCHGFGFPTSLLDFTPDFHIHILINKQRLMENRSAFIEKHSADDADRSKIGSGENVLSPIEKLFFNTVTYPIYMNLSKESKIDEYVNSNELSEDQMKDKVFNYLIKTIEQRLSHINKNKGSGSNQGPRSGQRSGPNTNFNQGNSGQGSRSSNEYSGPNQNLPSHYEDRENIYDEFYYPGAKKKLFDFNDEGVDYPDDYIKKNRPEESSDSSSSDSDDLEELRVTDKKKTKKKKIDSSSSSSPEDTVFLATVNEPQNESQSEQ